MVTEATTVYIHNIYVPVNASERSHFYRSLPTEFDQNSHHLVLGDLNVAIDPILDSRGVTSASDTSRGYLLSWLSTLHVTDAWRLRFPCRRLFSGPTPRINRLDYVFISDNWVDSRFEEARYFQAPHSGDHLALRVTLGTPSRRPLPAYWRLNPTTLQDDAVRQTIIQDIRQLQRTTRHTSSPGLVWEGWKRRIKSLLQLAQAKAGDQENDILPEPLTEAITAVESLEQVLADRRWEDDFDYHAHQMEASTAAFFRPPSPILRSTAVTSVVLPDGSECDDPADISDQFRQHWGIIFGDERFAGDEPPTPSFMKQASKSND
ncbi:Endonuclease/exonuclease/phosphatase [Plasmopara halstedii]|uniref:Endonuclease/exonuclease/phosphatase n=1 Tax=Plasmopara halstedii TaxID=4781 RepID=A0A0P1AVD5_PLAHL|nr:Endonuclease/exonuclease/phosphatase [Plasmopara halstedii]CEG44634.1 Endonuclease/exonuclease/phosphatase [Plasmopara halstedii]|eukprot:XP_024581003.1 Endonuclease/exonuclease/phosphatase [Plasmopara halstedii]